MIIFYRYLKEYFRTIPPKQFLFTTIFVAILVFINYQWGIENTIQQFSPWYLSLGLFFLFYLFVFGTVYLLQFSGKEQKNITGIKVFTGLIFLAAFLFTLKMIYWHFPFIDYKSVWGKYWSVTLQLPLKLLVFVIILFLIWKNYSPDATLTKFKTFEKLGFTTRHFELRPYLLILLCMVPLIGFASTQADFLHTYPKLNSISFIGYYTHPSWPWKLIYEISYGLDFVSIELFFRGFLVIGLMRFVGIDCILPMAAFYCTIHFGKPIGECISSYFGGLALGVIAYRTKSIIGGLMVHLGIAYLMEMGGYIGNF